MKRNNTKIVFLYFFALIATFVVALSLNFLSRFALRETQYFIQMTSLPTHLDWMRRLIILRLLIFVLFVGGAILWGKIVIMLSGAVAICLAPAYKKWFSLISIIIVYFACFCICCIEGYCVREGVCIGSVSDLVAVVHMTSMPLYEALFGGGLLRLLYIEGLLIGYIALCKRGGNVVEFFLKDWVIGRIVAFCVPKRKKDWLVKNAALMKEHKNEGPSVIEKKQHSLWNRPSSSDTESQRNATKDKTECNLRPLCYFFLVSVAFFALGKYYYDRHLQEMIDGEIKAYRSRTFTLAGYEIGRDLDSLDGYQRCTYSNCVSQTKRKASTATNRAPIAYGYHKTVALDKDEVIDGMKGFSKLHIDAMEYTEKGETRNRIFRICLTANGYRDEMRIDAMNNFASILEKTFGRRRFGRRIGEITGIECPNEKFVNFCASMNLEDGRTLCVRSNDPGQISVELFDCFVPK